MTEEYSGRTGSTGGISYQKMEQEVAETGHKYRICRLYPGLRGESTKLVEGDGRGTEPKRPKKDPFATTWRGELALRLVQLEEEEGEGDLGEFTVLLAHTLVPQPRASKQQCMRGSALYSFSVQPEVRQ